MNRAVLFLIFASACSSEPPDDIYEVTVTGGDIDGDEDATDCTTSTVGFEETYNYELYHNGGEVSIEINGQWFANGVVRGCKIEYESAAYLEETSDDANFTWQIVGDTMAQNQAGGCDISDGLDWSGTERFTVLSSSSDSVEEGCSYEMNVTGKLVQ